MSQTMKKLKIISMLADVSPYETTKEFEQSKESFYKFLESKPEIQIPETLDVVQDETTDYPIVIAQWACKSPDGRPEIIISFMKDFLYDIGVFTTDPCGQTIGYFNRQSLEDIWTSLEKLGVDSLITDGRIINRE
jgi:hypothetical protein